MVKIFWGTPKDTQEAGDTRVDGESNTQEAGNTRIGEDILGDTQGHPGSGGHPYVVVEHPGSGEYPYW